MRREDLDPPAIVQPAEESYSKAACREAIRKLLHGLILDKRAIGVWLKRIKDKCQHGEWGKECEAIGFPIRTADRWIEKGISQEPISATLADLSREASGDESEPPATPSVENTPPNQPQLFPVEPQKPLPMPGGFQIDCREHRIKGGKLVKGCKECDAQIKRIKAARKAAGEGGQKPPAGESPQADTPVIAPAPDVGDAAESFPEGTILDPDRNPLPPGATEAFQTAGGVEEALEPLRVACKAVDAFAQTPAGAYVNAKHIKTRIRAAAVQIKNKVLTPENTFRCDGHQGHGCPGNASCAKCEGKGLIPKPMKGDLGPKPKKPWRGRGR